MRVPTFTRCERSHVTQGPRDGAGKAQLRREPEDEKPGTESDAGIPSQRPIVISFPHGLVPSPGATEPRRDFTKAKTTAKLANGNANC